MARNSLVDVIFGRFEKSSPACVMYRSVLENVLSPEKLNDLFHGSAEVQYERELLFSSVVDLAGQVVCRIRPSIHAAYVAMRKEIPVSIRAVYDKVSNIEGATSRALVQHTAREVSELIDKMNGGRKPLLPGYRVRILDGNHLSGTDRRLGVLRNTGGAALPGQALVLLDPQRMVIDDVFPCEDAHAQERSLLGPVAESLVKRDLVIDDRNFCTRSFLFAIKVRKAYFITREHASMPWTSLSKAKCVGRCSTGRVFEEPVELTDPETGKTMQIRRITVKLTTPTEDGDKELHILTNLPAHKARATLVAELYRKRWTLEQAFNELTTQLRCELNTLAYPKAALFGFCVAICAYNVLAAVKGALRGVHGEKTVEKDVSNFFLTHQISGPYEGMMIALPPENWIHFQTMSPSALAKQLTRIARDADLGNYPKHTQAPTTTKRRQKRKGSHVATARLLEAAAEKRRKKRKSKSATT